MPLNRRTIRIINHGLIIPTAPYPNDTCRIRGRSTYCAPKKVVEQYKTYKASVHSTETNELEDWDLDTMPSKGHPFDITNFKTPDFFEDDDHRQHLSN